MPLYGEAKRAYQREWVRARRDEWIESQGGACVYCGSTDNLEVDHKDPKTKKCNPRAIWSRSKSFREVELAKCQVLCADCHKTKSDAEQTFPLEHGHYHRGYGKGCRCEKCTSSVAPYWRAYRARKSERD